MANYRKIYEQYYGVKIPKSYHIHHKDMNHKNDDPSNLEALFPDEHAQKHGFLNNFIMAQSTASERAALAHTRPEYRAKAALKSKGNKSHSGHKHLQVTRILISQNRKGKGLGNNNRLGTHHTPETCAKMSVTRTGKPHTPEHVASRAASCSRDWQITFLGGREETIKNLRAFCRVQGLNSGAMVRVSQGRRKHHKGFRCRKIAR